VAVSADGRTGDGAGNIWISLMIFLKVCDFEIQQQNNMPWEWCSCPSPNQVAFCKTTLKSIKDQS
jgi:hypothetical protein